MRAGAYVCMCKLVRMRKLGTDVTSAIITPVATVMLPSPSNCMPFHSILLSVSIRKVLGVSAWPNSIEESVLSNSPARETCVLSGKSSLAFVIWTELAKALSTLIAVFVEEGEPNSVSPSSLSLPPFT